MMDEKARLYHESVANSLERLASEGGTQQFSPGYLRALAKDHRESVVEGKLVGKLEEDERRKIEERKIEDLKHDIEMGYHKWSSWDDYYLHRGAGDKK